MMGTTPPLYLTLADYLILAEDVTGIPAEQLLPSVRVAEAESALAAPRATYGGHGLYPDLRTQVAILVARLVRNHPLIDGNKRTALLAGVEFAERNGLRWRPAETDAEADEDAQTIAHLAAGSLSERAFVEWVSARLEPVAQEARSGEASRPA